MKSQLVLGGRFRVYEDGRINKFFDGVETPANTVATGRMKKYLVVYWSENGKQKHAYVHRVIASAFLENPDKLPQVNHKDGNTMNNCVENLEWVTPGQNVRHAYRTGLNTPMAYGKPCAKCGELTLAKSGICPACKLEEKLAIAEKRQEEIRQARIDRYKSINLEICTDAERQYVKLATKGMSIPQIAEAFEVSKQCVGAALLNAEKKTVCGITIPKTAQDEQDRLERKVYRLKKKYEDAKLQVELYEKEYKDSIARLEQHKKEMQERYGVRFDQDKSESIETAF